MASYIASHSYDCKLTSSRDGRKEQLLLEPTECPNKCEVTRLEHGSPQLFGSFENSSRTNKRKISTLKHGIDKHPKKLQTITSAECGRQQLFEDNEIRENHNHLCAHEILMPTDENEKQFQFDIAGLFERNLYHVVDQILSNLKGELDRLNAAKALWPMLEKHQLLKLLGLSEPLEPDPCFAELYKVRRNQCSSLATSTSEPNDTQLSCLHDQSNLYNQNLVDLMILKYNWKNGIFQEHNFNIQPQEYTTFTGYTPLVLFSHRYIVIASSSTGRVDKRGRSKCHTSIALYDLHDFKKINEISVPRPYDGETSRLNTAMSGNAIVFSAVSTVVVWELDTFRVRILNCLRPGTQLMKLLKYPIFFMETDEFFLNTGADVFCDSNILVNCVNTSYCHTLAVYNISDQQENLLLEEKRDMFIRKIETGPAYYFLLLQRGELIHLQLRSKENFSLNMTIDLSPRDDLTISCQETMNSCFVQEFFISCRKLEVRCIQHRKLLHRFTSRRKFSRLCTITTAFGRLFALDKSRLTYWDLGNDLLESWRKGCSSEHSTVATSSAIAQLALPESIVSFRQIKLYCFFIGWYEDEVLEDPDIKSRTHRKCMHITKASFFDDLEK